MDKKEKIILKAENCPIRNVLHRFGDKWSLLILFKLSDDFALTENFKMRFNELHKSVEGISQKMLTTTLKTMEADGLVSRKVYPEIPPKVEYSLTKLGLSLVPHISNLSSWAFEHQSDILKSRENYKR